LQAGALVVPGTVVPARSMMMGVPARRVREVTDEEFEADPGSCRTLPGIQGRVQRVVRPLNPEGQRK